VRFWAFTRGTVAPSGPVVSVGVLAVTLSEFGPPSVLVPAEVADPVAGAGQALIDVAFVNITFVETQIRAGRPPNPAMAPKLPAIPGNGVGGVVSAVGDGVDAGLVGTRVISSTGGSGAYAEQVAVPSGGLIAVPDSLSLETAVALLADGRTAVLLARSAALGTGDRVLVLAAAGGVGTLLVQLALNAGASVVGAAGSDRKLELIRSLGAELAVDYSQPGWVDEIGRVDVAFDGVGGEVGSAAFLAVAPGGRMSAFGFASGAPSRVGKPEALARDVTLIRGTGVTPETLIEATEAALALADAGRLRPVIGQKFPLAQAADAHAAIESRATVGKTLLVVD
jgi:NADPH2:quinone reductase